MGLQKSMSRQPLRFRAQASADIEIKETNVFDESNRIPLAFRDRLESPGAADVAGDREPHHSQPSTTILPRAVVLSSVSCTHLRFAALMGENRSVRVVRTSPASTRLAMADRI